MKIIKKIKENIVYKNKFATMYDDDVMFPDGSKGRYVKFFWNIPYGVAIIATNKEGEVLLVNEYSYRKSKWGWSIPKGMGEIDVSSVDQARNELKEESGYLSKELDYKFTLREIVDTKEGVHFYRTFIDEKEKGELDLDDGESISGASFYKLNDVMEMIKNNEIDCYHTSAALMYLFYENQ